MDVDPLIAPAFAGNAVTETLILLTAALHNTDVTFVVNVNVIEHGLAEYFNAYDILYPSSYNIIKKWISRTLGYDLLVNCESVWLCSNYLALNRNPKISQHNFESKFSKYVDCFQYRMWTDAF